MRLLHAGAQHGAIGGCAIGANPYHEAMARRSSNRDRIARMRDEADAAREGQPQGKTIAVWAVKNGAGEIVATFPYARKSDAEADARRRMEEEERDFIVVPHKTVV